MSHELRVPPKLLAAMRSYVSDGGALPPAARFSWPNIASSGAKQRVWRAKQAVTCADEASTDANGSANRSGDLALAFNMAPVGMLVSRQRMVDKYNQEFCGMFGCEMDVLTGRSLEFLYPSRDEFVHVGTRALMIMRKTGFYSDERIMRRVDDRLLFPGGPLIEKILSPQPYGRSRHVSDQADYYRTDHQGAADRNFW
ncbi:hypothetical protein [Paraburkholderia sp. BL6665CI2N2]|uniref:hypothetical protein n=1 Tax=Paraburkholderia sp. BL6665CI2N2 TaxID=1938806 RepID=UPI001FBA5C93|nr:hypothetical protein [Paraburkholderia sp. BL6665CI2N2]